MMTEFEATFLHIEKKDIRQRLKAVGAEMVYPECILRRVVFHPPLPVSGGWLRVRQEPDKVTMSLKVVDGNKIENQREADLVINSVEAGIAFLEAIGAVRKAYQETTRELWELDGVEICIDVWPGLDPYVEVEGKSEEAVILVSEKIGFDYSDAFFGHVGQIYEKELGIPEKVFNDEMSEITFENPPTHG